MPLTLTQLIEEAMDLPPIPLKSTTAYATRKEVLARHVNKALDDQPDINDLIGSNPRHMMYENHRHHAAFMATVFTIGSYELLAKTVPWVYRTYKSHGFSFKYFPLELSAWQEAIRHHMSDVSTAEINAVYEWLLATHETMISLSQNEISKQAPIRSDFLETKDSFQNALLAGDHAKCLEIAQGSVISPADLEDFYQLVILPSMYEIGMLWEMNRISAALEHLTAAIVSRIMSIIYKPDPKTLTFGGRIIITAAPNEYHSIGARMLADIFELDGWSVWYLGQNTPVTSLLDIIGRLKPHVLALSVTMPFNISGALEITSAIKAHHDLSDTKVMIGGLVFNENRRLWKATGADAFAATPAEAKLSARALVPKLA